MEHGSGLRGTSPASASASASASAACRPAGRTPESSGIDRAELSQRPANGRLLVDVSYSRLQKHVVGITRVVRRLAEELPAAAGVSGTKVTRVAFDGQGFRDSDAIRTPAEVAREPLLLGWARGVAKPVIERILGLVWPLARPVWEHAAARAFGQAAGPLPVITFRQGDILLLFDASWNYPVWRGAQRARHQGAVVVPLVHDLMPITAPQFCLPWVRHAFRYWLERTIESSDVILCNSAATEHELRQFAHRNRLELPPTGHFRLGCDPFTVAGGSVRESVRRLACTDRGFVATVGSIEPKKNHTVLLAATELLWQKGHDIPLLVLGRRTPECSAVIRRMESLAEQGRPLLLVDDASDAEVAFAYEHASALVLPSMFEGFGLPLVEARSRGCPVLASSIPAFMELADSGTRFFDPADPAALAELMQQVLRVPAIPRTASSAYSWQSSAEQCLDTIRFLLRGPARPDAERNAQAPPRAFQRKPRS